MINSPPQLVGYGQGFARSVGLSAAPDQYAPFMFIPALGATGVVREVGNSGIEGTLQGSSFWAADGVRGTIISDGDQILLAHNSRLTPSTGEYTWEILLRVDVAIGNFAPLYSQDGHGGAFNFQYRTNADGFKIIVFFSGNDVNITSNVNYVVGQTYHLLLAVSAIRNFAAFYINGTLVGTDAAVSGTVGFDATDWQIGKRFDGTTLGFMAWPGIYLSPGAAIQRSQDFFAPLRLRPRLAVKVPAVVAGNPWWYYRMISQGT